MKGISQILVAVLMIAAVLVAVSMYGYLATNLISTYKPSSVAVARVGDLDMELENIDVSTYVFSASLKLLNMGSSPLVLQGAKIYVLLIGSTGKTEVLSCATTAKVLIRPGSTGTITASCIIGSLDLRILYGTATPPADEVKKSARFLFLETYFEPVGGGAPQHGIIIW